MNYLLPLCPKFIKLRYEIKFGLLVLAFLSALTPVLPSAN